VWSKDPLGRCDDLPLRWTSHPEVLLGYQGDFVACLDLRESQNVERRRVDGSRRREVDNDIGVRMLGDSLFNGRVDRFPQIKVVALIAEGVPERHARELLHLAQKKNVMIIGPATVGGIKMLFSSLDMPPDLET
jgi:hypothetical protein